MPGVEFQAIFCTRREPNRQWELPPLQFPHIFLRERFVSRGSNFIHNNPDVLTALRRLNPDVIVTTGFNPTHLYAFAYAQLRGIPHVPMTDGTDVSEQSLSFRHRWVRKLVYARSKAFVSASLGGRRLYQTYGVPLQHWFQSCLCVDNNAYLRTPEPEHKEFDLIFCGRLVEDKNPLFALQVAAGVGRRLGRRTRILFVGSGEQEGMLRAAADEMAADLDASFHGHAEQNVLPSLYRSASVFLFPTAGDVWGVVANEACAAELPIIVSPNAGVVGELVLDGQNGFVRELELEQWVEATVSVLARPALRQRFAQCSAKLVNRFTFEQAAIGIVDACRHATDERYRNAVKVGAKQMGRTR